MDAIALSSWAVSTSESRHYQSPQIVQAGNAVTLANTIAFTDYGTYAEATAMVKGRLYVGTNLPIESPFVNRLP